MSHSIRAAAACFLSVLAAGAWGQYATAIKIKNQVQACGPQVGCRAVKFGSKVPEGDTVVTADSSYGQFRFPTGSTVAINPNSRMVLSATGSGKKDVKTEWGRFDFEIKSRDTKSKFQVHTPVITAGSEGTVFHIGVDRATGRTLVALRDGALRVTQLSAAGTTILLQPGYYLIAEKDKPLPQPMPIPQPGAPGKTKGQKSTGGAEAAETEDADAAALQDVEIPSVETQEAAEAQQASQAPEPLPQTGSDRLYETGQNASGGFIVQQAEELKETAPPPTVSVKKESKVIIWITEE